MVAHSCPSCGSSDTTRLRHYRYSSPIYNICNLYYCKSCSLTYASPLPAEQELNAYNSSYFNSAHGGLAVSSAYFFNAIARARFSYILHNTSIAQYPKLSVLEVGPGSGSLASVFFEQLPTTTYDVIESDVSLFPRLSELGASPFSDFSMITNKQYDLIIMSHVLEHIPSPVSYLSTLKQFLSPSGFLFLEVPCSDHLHKTIDEPHLLFFTKDSLLNTISLSGLVASTAHYYGQSIHSLIHCSRLSLISRHICMKFLSLRLIRSFFSVIPLPFPYTNLYSFFLLFLSKAAHKSHEPAWWLRLIASF